MAIATLLNETNQISDPSYQLAEASLKPLTLEDQSFRPSEQFSSELLEIEKKLYNQAFRLIGNRADAEDLVSETILRAIQNEHRYMGPNLFNWCCRILERLHLDLLRKRSRRLKTESLDNESISGDTDRTFHDIIPDKSTLTSREQEITSLLTEEIFIQISNLSKEHQKIIQLRFIEDLTPKEIAPILNIEEVRVRSRIHHAKTSLLKLLNTHGYTPDRIADTIFYFMNESD